MFRIKKKQKLTGDEKRLHALTHNLVKLTFDGHDELKKMREAIPGIEMIDRILGDKEKQIYYSIIGSEERKELIELLNKRLNREPLEYIIGAIEFLKRTFKTNPEVYITAPETEWLIYEAKDVAKNIGAKKILDVGTGNGCLGLTLALEYSGIESLVLSDISPKALEVAKQNITKYQKELPKTNITTAISSYVNGLDCEEPDIILACLPWGDENNILESNKKRELNKTHGDKIKLKLYTNGIGSTCNFGQVVPPDRKAYVKVKNELIYRDLSKMPSIAIHPPSHPLEAYELLFESIQRKGWNKSIVIFETGMHNFMAVDRILPSGYKLEQKHHTDTIKGTNEFVPSITLEGNVSIAYQQRK